MTKHNTIVPQRGSFNVDQTPPTTEVIAAIIARRCRLTIPHARLVAGLAGIGKEAR